MIQGRGRVLPLFPQDKRTFQVDALLILLIPNIVLVEEKWAQSQTGHPHMLHKKLKIVKLKIVNLEG